MGLTHFGSKPPVAIVGTAFLIIGFIFNRRCCCLVLTTAIIIQTSMVFLHHDDYGYPLAFIWHHYKVHIFGCKGPDDCLDLCRQTFAIKMHVCLSVQRKSNHIGDPSTADAEPSSVKLLFYARWLLEVYKISTSPPNVSLNY